MHSDTARHGTARASSQAISSSPDRLLHDGPIPDPSLALLSSAVERRAAVRLANERKANERRRELELMTAPTLGPRERISTWERIHALVLPRAPDHPLAALIASQTGLTLEDINAEQQRRRELGGC